MSGLSSCNGMLNFLFNNKQHLTDGFFSPRNQSATVPCFTPMESAISNWVLNCFRNLWSAVMGRIIADSDWIATGKSDYLINDNQVMKFPGFAHRFSKLLSKSDYADRSQKEIGIWLGVSQPTVNDWLKGEKLPSMETAIRVAGKLKCQVEYLLTGNGQSVEDGPNIKGLSPLISYVQAGDFCEAIDNFQPGDAEDWIPRPKDAGPNTYCLRVVGNSMTSSIPGAKTYPEGTIIFVDPSIEPVSGRRVIAKIPSCQDVTFKEYRVVDGRHWLVPINTTFDKIELTEHIHICGVVIGKWEGE